MASQFKVIGVFGRVKSAGVTETLKALISYLRSLQKEVCIDEETAAALHDPTIKGTPREELGKKCDLLIVVGGDGSFLHATHTVVNDEVPMLGINRGSLGFLTDIIPTELKKIKAILDGEYILEKRFLLTATVEYQGKVLSRNDALNEVALIPDASPHMYEFEVYVNDQFMCSQDSDGIIVATPTGSTAYALSGGGPILHPELDAMVIVPMFPHTLSIRPIVIEGNHRVSILISPRNSATPRVTCDGQTAISTPPGSRIDIVKKSQRLQLIHPKDYDYYAALRSKLFWGRKLHSE